jgi:hypothetical protein
MFLHPLGSVGHILHSGASGAQNVNIVFFILVWAQCGFDKKHDETRYSEPMFFNLVGSTVHIVHSRASGCKTLMRYF